MKIQDNETGMIYEIPASEEGKTLLALLRKRQVFLDAPCNGKGTCGKCKIKFLSGAPEATEKERRLLTEKELAAGMRLACHTVPQGDCVINTGAGNHGWTGGGELKRTGAMTAALGIAIDIGTTTLAASMFDMDTGRELAVATGINHQRSFGADVISRIEAANRGLAKELQLSIQKDLELLISKLLADESETEDESGAKTNHSHIKKVVIAGNTTMCHLLLGLSCEKLGKAPFEPVDISLQRRRWNGTEIVILPGISAFVGADIVAGIYANDMTEHEEISMLLDIGTNGEMVIGNKHGILVTSTAAGPVFEGGNISCGVAGIPGAISHVQITLGADRECRINYKTINDMAPTGLCGSAVLDTVSELSRNEMLDETGLLQDPWFETGVMIAGTSTEDRNEKVQQTEQKSGDEPSRLNICLTQKDIREVQMAKGAIRAGIELLQETYGEKDKAQCIYLAGGFGYFMDVESAFGIGMFPADFRGKIKSVGNASLEGAKRFLLEDAAENSGAENRIKKILALAKEINLAMHPDFNDRYVEYMNF
jgi:uncharacterized 2Fe-2S/4Fe-4S cluster protein (DUF4445 family)